MSYACPKCRKDTSLWRGVDVPGWQSCDGDLKPARIGHPNREIEWSDAEANGEYGCAECGFKGCKGDLVTLGLNGESLPVIHPQQGRLA